MTSTQPLQVKPISKIYQSRELSEPEHPQIKIIKFDAIMHQPPKEADIIQDFHSITLKMNINVSMMYAHPDLDYKVGIMGIKHPQSLSRVLKLKSASPHWISGNLYNITKNDIT